MRITGPLARAASRRERRGRLWDDERFREVREEDLAQPLTSIRSLLVATIIWLVLATLLTTGKLVEIAERQPVGSSRDRWLALAEGADRTANFLSLNRPYDLIIDVRGTGEDAGQRVDTIDEVAEQAGLAPIPTVPPATTAASAVTTPTVVASPSSTSTTVTVPPALRMITDTAPLRVYVAGDSQAEFLGQALITDSDGRAVDVTLDHRISTSLARPDYFNWPAELAAVVSSADPEAVVLFLGANEDQDMVTAAGDRVSRGSPEWRIEWSRRLEITLDLLEADHRRVFWIGQPPMRNGRLDEGVALINELASSVMTARSHVMMVDIWLLFGGDGDYRERVRGPDGEETRARVDDGVHLTRAAAGWVGEMVFAEMDDIWEFTGD